MQTPTPPDPPTEEWVGFDPDALFGVLEYRPPPSPLYSAEPSCAGPNPGARAALLAAYSQED